MNYPGERPSREHVFALVALSMLAFLAVELPCIALLKLFVGSAPQWAGTFPGLATGASLGLAIGQQRRTDRETFLYFLRVQGTVAAAGLAFAGVIKATGGF